MGYEEKQQEEGEERILNDLLLLTSLLKLLPVPLVSS